jgi:tetratricopeptide (TPR) repeat protein
MALLRAVVGVLTCCLMLAAPARPVAAADSAQGRDAFAEGQKLFLAGEYHGALTWFKNGYQQTQDPAFLLNIAQCHRSLGEAQEALMMFSLYLKSSPEGSNPQARSVATKAIKELEGEVGTARPAPSAAAAAAGSSAAVAAVPHAAPAKAVAPEAGSGPDSRRKFQSGPGDMPFLEPLPELDAKKASETAAEVPDNTQATVRHLRLAAMVCGAIGLISGGVGLYYWTRARSLSDSADKATIYNQAAYDDGKQAERMQWIFYGVGAAALATGAGLLMYGKWFVIPKQAKVSLAPMAAPGSAGLAAVGTF